MLPIETGDIFLLLPLCKPSTYASDSECAAPSKRNVSIGSHPDLRNLLSERRVLAIHDGRQARKRTLFKEDLITVGGTSKGNKVPATLQRDRGKVSCLIEDLKCRIPRIGEDVDQSRDEAFRLGG